VYYLLLPWLLTQFSNFKKLHREECGRLYYVKDQSGRKDNNPTTISKTTPNFPDSPVFCLLGKREIEREREREIVGFSQTILCHSQVQFTTVYKVLIIFFFFFSFRNTATTTTTTTTAT
jgi:hypothetical protein